ncbi:MAG: CsgG/HfaB family protein [Candidatus Spyradenecus sp.]
MRGWLIVGVLAMAGVAMGQSKFAVTLRDFEVKPGVRVSREVVADIRTRLGDALANSGRFTLLERKQLKEFVAEQELGDSGMTDGEVPQSNALRSSKWIIYGTVMNCNVSRYLVNGVAFQRQKLEMQLRLANGESGEVVAIKTVNGEASAGTLIKQEQHELSAEALREVVQDLVVKACDGIIDVIDPARVVSVNRKYVFVNLTEAQVKEGDRLEVLTGEDVPVGNLIVVIPGIRNSRCEPDDESMLEDFSKGMRVVRAQEKPQRAKPKPSNMNRLRNMRR